MKDVNIIVLSVSLLFVTGILIKLMLSGNCFHACAPVPGWPQCTDSPRCPDTDDHCPTSSTDRSTKKYYVSLTQINWYQAQLECASRNMQLATIMDYDELEAFKHVLLGQEDSYFWIGLTDLAEEGNFTWINGRAHEVFDVWCADAPDNWQGDEHCVHAYRTDDGVMCWNDLECASEQGYICEYY